MELRQSKGESRATGDLFARLDVLALEQSPMPEGARRAALCAWLEAYCNVEVVCWTGDLSRTDWLFARRQGIGGSDRGAIRGVDRFKGRGALYLEKRSEAPIEDEPDYREGESSPRFWGSQMEHGIVRGFRVSHPDWLVVQIGATVRSMTPGDEHNLYSADAIAMHPNGEMVVLDVKYPRREEGWWEHLDDNATGEATKAATLPESYALQVAHGMLVFGPLFTMGMVLALVGHRDLIRFFRRDEQEIAQLRDESAAFWAKVKAPELDVTMLDGHESTTEAVKVWVGGRPAVGVRELSDEAFDLVQQWEDEKAKVKEIEAAAKSAKAAADQTANMLRVLLDGADAGTFFDGSALTNAEQGGSWGVRKDLSPQEEQEWEQTRPRFMKQSRFRVLRYKARKGKGKV
ncbi:MAG: hypothetical protein AMXMBFR64_60740 [Myxococcales bacterium]